MKILILSTISAIIFLILLLQTVFKPKGYEAKVIIEYNDHSIDTVNIKYSRILRKKENTDSLFNIPNVYRYRILDKQEIKSTD